MTNFKDTINGKMPRTLQNRMNMGNLSYIQVIFTADTLDQAESIGLALLEKRLVASVQTVSVWSQYWWQGKIRKRQEFRCNLKTRMDLWPQVAVEIRARHTYELPEIFAVPLVEGTPEYLNWLTTELAGGEYNGC